MGRGGVVGDSFGREEIHGFWGKCIQFRWMGETEEQFLAAVY